MTTTRPTKKRRAIVRKPGEGRKFPMGPLRATFKADRAETKDRSSISEWWLDPWTKGPPSHRHEEDDVFYVLEGTMSFMVGERWTDCPKGSFVLVPGDMPHSFENRTGKPAGMLNVSAPGGFEEHMPPIAAWF